MSMKTARTSADGCGSARILTTGTRDLLLSNTVRVHRKLKDAGVEAELNVFEAMSHGNYSVDDTAPETHQAFGDIAHFFDRHLTK